MYAGNNADQSFVMSNVPYSPSRFLRHQKKSTMLPHKGDEIIELQSGCSNSLKLKRVM